MNKENCRKKAWLVGVFCLMSMLVYSDAFARGMERPRTVQHQQYNYHDGRFYRPGWIGAIVRALPFGHRTVIIRGSPYYSYENIYYKPCPSGYIVIPAPATDLVVVVNVPNSNGSYTPVKLVKNNNGYIGPQGEYYSGNPTVEQLRALYGK